MIAHEPLLVLPHKSQLIPGRLVRRWNRFLADIDLEDGKRIVAHCVNTGRMECLTRPGLRVWVSRSDAPGRKLAYTWELVEVDGVLVGANTALPNAFVRALLEKRMLRGLSNWDEMKAEKKYGENSRVDFWLRKGAREHFIEVKNCHLVYPDKHGYFPDSVSERATKHLDELMEVVRQGHGATVIFTAQRGDTKAMRPSDIHDPAFAAAARRAKECGVDFRAIRIRPTLEAMVIEQSIPVDMKEYDTGRMQRWMDENRAIGPAWVTVKRS
ncbi:DNA/RNA nuclease SfsA [Candidatus Sumerlaeota bacterium]|nr:DNA/RNA nuclease SfsA [Candidatus Sumerlaeota bacterium]